MANSSRLRRHKARESKRQLYIYGVVIVAIVILLLTFGSNVIEFIGNTSLLVRGTETKEGVSEKINVVQPPILEPLPNATSESSLTVKGKVVQEGGVVSLYINNRKIESKEPENTNFTFDISLEEGENRIKSRYVKNDEESEFSDVVSVSYLTEAPILEEISPADNSKFGRGDERIEVSGKTTPGSKVTVGGSRAIVNNNGEFSYFYKLEDGENKIEIVATNDAGLSEKKTVTVKYSS